MQGDGDGWVHCAAGHRHWGRFGAAGILISDGRRAILQHRAPWTHEGGRWGLPGGARDSHEDPTSTALREANEEAAIVADVIDPTAIWVDDHGGWSYTTVLARPALGLTDRGDPNGPAAAIAPHAANAESTEVRWCDLAEIEALPLHHGLAATWPGLWPAPPVLTIVVDVREATPLHGLGAADGVAQQRLAAFARHGLPATALPPGRTGSGATALLAHISVVDPEADGGPSARRHRGWWERAIETVSGDENIDSEIVRRAQLSDLTGQTIVVTASGEVSAALVRWAPQTSVVPPQWLADQLGRHASG